MGCLSAIGSVFYFWIVIGVASASRHDGPGIVFFGVLFWYFGRGILRGLGSLFGAGEPEKPKVAEVAAGLPPGKLDEVRRFGELRERLARGLAGGVVTAEEHREVSLELGKRERRFWKAAERFGATGAAGSAAGRDRLHSWLADAVSAGSLRPAAREQLLALSLEEAYPGGASLAPESEPAVAPAPETVLAAVAEAMATPQSQAAPDPLAGLEPEGEIVFLHSEADPDTSEAPEPEPEGQEPAGRQEQVAPGVHAWVPEEAAEAGVDYAAILAEERGVEAARGELPAPDPEPPSPSVWDRLRATFVEEGQVRWAEAAFALFTLLAFVTGVVSIGYYWGHLPPLLRFGLLVGGAGVASGLSAMVSRRDGLEETGRTLGVIAHLLAPVTLGALPFLVGPDYANLPFAGALAGGAVVLGFGLRRIEGLTLGNTSDRYAKLFVAASVSAALLPKLLVGSPFRGLLFTSCLMAWLGADGARQGGHDDDTWAGGDVLRATLPVYLMGVAVAAAAGVHPLEGGAWAFALSAGGYLLWTAAIHLGAGGEEFPTLPLYMQAGGFAAMALATGSCLILDPVFWGNTWLLASLTPPFFAATVQAVKGGGGRAAYSSALLLTVLSVLGAGPGLGAHSTLMLIPVAGCALGALYLEARGPGASEAYTRAGQGLLIYALAQGIRAPAEGLTSSVALLAMTLPLAMVLRLRAAFQAAAGASAGVMVFGVATLWILPARVGWPALGPLGGAAAAAPWLLVAAVVLGLLQRFLGSRIESDLSGVRRPGFFAHESSLDLWHPWLCLAALPGVVVALMEVTGWELLAPHAGLRSAGVLGPGGIALAAALAAVAGFPRAERERAGAGHAVVLPAVFAAALFGGSVAGLSGVALGLGVASLVAGWLTAEAGGWVIGGPPGAHRFLPLPFAVLLAGSLFGAVVAVPDLLGWFLDPTGTTPPYGPPLGVLLLILAGWLVHRGVPFSAHLHLAPLGVGYACLSLSQYLPLRERAGLLAGISGVMAAWGLTSRWRSARDAEAAGGGGPLSAGWMPLVDGPMALAVASLVATLPDVVLTCLHTVLDVVFGLVSGVGKGFATPDAAGAAVLVGFGLVAARLGAAYPRARFVGVLGGFSTALGITAAIDRLWWPDPLRPTFSVLSAAMALVVLELMAHPISDEEETREVAAHLRAGGAGLILLIGAAGGWLAAHMHRFGPVYEAMRLSTGGFALTSATFLIALAGWGRTVRGSRVGTHQLCSSLSITVGLAGAYLGGLVGAAWGFAAAAVLAGELGQRYSSADGPTRIGGGPGSSLRDPLPSAALVALGFLTLTILIPDMLFEQLPWQVAPALLLGIWAGVRVNRAAPFSFHLHLGTGYLYYGLWMATRRFDPDPSAFFAFGEAPERAAALGALAFLVTLVGFTRWWNERLELESAGGGGPASWGFKPLVDVSLIVAGVVVIYGGPKMLQVVGSCLWAADSVTGSGVRWAGGWELGILPLLGFGATLVAARARAPYAGLLGIGYGGGVALAAGLTAGLAWFVPAPRPALAFLVATAGVAWLLDYLATRVDRAHAPSSPRHLRTGALASLGLLGLAGFDMLLSSPASGLARLETVGVVAFLAALGAGAALASRMGHRGSWGAFAWPYAALGLFAAHVGVHLVCTQAGWPVLDFSRHGQYAAALLGGVGLVLGWRGLHAAPRRFANHLALAVWVLGGLALCPIVDLVDRTYWSGAWWDMITWGYRPAFFGAIGVGAVAALALRGVSHARPVLMTVTPFALVLAGVPLARLSIAPVVCFVLASALSEREGYTWFAVPVAGFGCAVAGFALAYTATGEGPALLPAAVLGIAAVGLALERLAGLRALWDDSPPSLLRGYPAALMRRQSGALEWLVGGGLVLVLLVPLVDAGRLLTGYSTLFPPGSSSLLYGALTALAATVAALQAGDRPVAAVAALTWVWAGQLAWQAGVGAAAPEYAWRAAGALGAMLSCLVIGEFASRREGPVAEGLAAGTIPGVAIGLLQLVGALRFPAADMYVVAAAVAPTLGAVHLFLQAARRESETLVYLGEASLAGTFAYLKVSGILGTTVYGQIAIQATAFLLLGLAQFAEQRGWTVFERPFRRTSLVLPALVMVRACLGVDWKGFDGWGQFALGAMASAFYGIVGVRDDKGALRYLSGACLYLGVSLLCYHRYELRDFANHLDFYVVPLGLLVVLFSVLERENLLEEQQKTMRLVGLLLVYVSPGLHAVQGASPAQTIALVVLGVAGTLVGVATRVQLFTLFGLVSTGTGVAAYLLNVVQMAKWNFAFLTFSVLAAGTGYYSLWARKQRREIGLS